MKLVHVNCIDTDVMDGPTYARIRGVQLFGGAPALLFGIEDPKSNPHAPNESLHEDDFQKLMATLAIFMDNLSKLPDGKVKGETHAAAPAVT